MPRGKTDAVVRLIDACVTILEQIQPASVRAVCYQLFVQGLIEAVSKLCPNRISRHLVYAREQNIVPWNWIVDETREVERLNAWKNPAAFVRTVKRAYRPDHWASQPAVVEIVSEKNTVKGTVAPLLDEYGVSFRPMHGYGSATKLHGLAEAVQASLQPMVELYLGDWDPSGLHMSEVGAPRRLRKYGGGALRWNRIALTPELIREHDLPGFDVDAKYKDRRYRWYRTSQGARAWELDALNPNNLRTRVEEAFRSYIEWPTWERCQLTENATKETIRALVPIISRQATK